MKKIPNDNSRELFPGAISKVSTSSNLREDVKFSTRIHGNWAIGIFTDP